MCERLGRNMFEGLLVYNEDTEGQITFIICGFDGNRRDNYFEGEPVRRTEVEVRLKK